MESETITSNLICPLYVKYKKKKAEYRVHVFDGKIMDVQQKKKRRGVEQASTYVRNHANGWVYCREDIIIPKDLFDEALNACAALSLTFAAVDIIYNQRDDKCYVLECNTAPGLDGTTVDFYGNAIKEYIHANNH